MIHNQTILSIIEKIENLPGDHITYADWLGYQSGWMWQDAHKVITYRTHCSKCYSCAGLVATLEMDYPELENLIPPDSRVTDCQNHVSPKAMRDLFDCELDDYSRGRLVIHFMQCKKCFNEYIHLKANWLKMITSSHPQWKGE